MLINIVISLSFSLFMLFIDKCSTFYLSFLGFNIIPPLLLFLPSLEEWATLGYKLPFLSSGKHTYNICKSSPQGSGLDIYLDFPSL